MKPIDISRKDFYLVDQPQLKERTKNRLIEISEMGMEEVGCGQFGKKNVMSGLYFEMVWFLSDEMWNNYISWAKDFINSKKERMKILHITPATNGYEEVDLIANQVSETNSFAVIEKNGQQFMTGGFLINDTPEIRKVLDSIPKEKQYDFIKDFKMDPFVKFYFEE